MYLSYLSDLKKVLKAENCIIFSENHYIDGDVTIVHDICCQTIVTSNQIPLS